MLLFSDSPVHWDHSAGPNLSQGTFYLLEHHLELGSLLEQFFQGFHKYHLFQKLIIYKFIDGKEQYYVCDKYKCMQKSHTCIYEIY